MQFTRAKVHKSLQAVLPVSSTVQGFVSSSDIGKTVFKTSNQYGLCVGTTADNQPIAGIVAAVPTATTPASTTPFYIAPVNENEEVEESYSTTASTALPATTDIGKYIGYSNTTTVAGAVLSMGTIGNAAGTTSGCFLRITGFNNTRKIIRGLINSSHISQ